MAISRSSKSDEQKAITDETYTPPWLFDILGVQFDLDVASPVEPLSWHIPAHNRYTIEDNALEQPWHGKVWMNPPYSKATPWVSRFLEHNNGIALLPFTRGKWFTQLWQSDAAFALPTNGEKLFTFVTRDGKNKGIFMPVALIAMGDECKQALHNIGRIR